MTKTVNKIKEDRIIIKIIHNNNNNNNNNKHYSHRENNRIETNKEQYSEKHDKSS